MRIALLTTSIVIFASFSVMADIPVLLNINQKDMDNINREMGAAWAHTSVSDAKSLGEFWGLEVGPLASTTKSPRTEHIISRTKTEQDGGYLPSAGALIRASIPMGLTLESVTTPKINAANIEFYYQSYGAQWTLTHFLKRPWFELAAVGHFSKTIVKYQQDVADSANPNTPIHTNIEYRLISYGGSLKTSFSFLFIHPFVGYGWINSNATLMAFAGQDVNVIDPSAATINANTAKSKSFGAHFYSGLEFNLLLFKLGLEYSKIMHAEKVSMKLTFSL